MRVGVLADEENLVVGSVGWRVVELAEGYEAVEELLHGSSEASLLGCTGLVAVQDSVNIRVHIGHLSVSARLKQVNNFCSWQFFCLHGQVIEILKIGQKFPEIGNLLDGKDFLGKFWQMGRFFFFWRFGAKKGVFSTTGNLVISKHSRHILIILLWLLISFLGKFVLKITIISKQIQMHFIFGYIKINILFHNISLLVKRSTKWPCRALPA